MTPAEKTDKEMEVFTWMKKKGYDRRASKEVAPIIVNYLEEVVKNISSKQDVIKSVCDICDGTTDKPTYKLCDKHYTEYEKFKQTVL